MPEVVQQFLDQGHSIPGIRALQNEPVAQYRVDIGKHAEGQALRVREIFDHLPLQLEEPEGRFVLSSLGKDVRFERWKTDFLWLVNAGVALKTECVSEAKSPLRRAREGFVLCRNNVAVEYKAVYPPFYMTFCLSRLTEQSLGGFAIDPWMPGEAPAAVGTKGSRFDQL